MKKLRDFFFYVMLPILSGAGLYFLKLWGNIPGLINNYLPDGLWAFAFVSSILIIWDREINKLWLGIAFISFILFEFLQGIHIIAGTGDYKDIVCYLAFSFLALIINNKIYKHHYETKS